MDNPCWEDPGEWGLIYWHTAENNINDTLGYYIYEPDELIIDEHMNFISVSEIYEENTINIDFAFSEAVGIDEYHPNVGLNEAEMIPTGLFVDGKQKEGQGVAMSPPHLVLSPMNYGNIWMQGMDLGVTQLIPEYNLIINGNFN